MRPAAISRGVCDDVVHAEKVDAARAELQRRADGEQIAFGTIHHCDVMHERLPGVTPEQPQPVTLEPRHVAQGL